MVSIDPEVTPDPEVHSYAVGVPEPPQAEYSLDVMMYASIPAEAVKVPDVTQEELEVRSIGPTSS